MEKIEDIDIDNGEIYFRNLVLFYDLDKLNEKLKNRDTWKSFDDALQNIEDKMSHNNTATYRATHPKSLNELRNILYDIFDHPLFQHYRIDEERYHDIISLYVKTFDEGK